MKGACVCCLFCCSRRRQVLAGLVLVELRALCEGLLGHDGIKLVGANLAVAVGVCTLDHLHEFGVRHGLAKLLGHTLEVSEGDVPRLVVVKEVEDFLDVFPGVLVAHFCGHHVQELLEVDGSTAVFVDVANHLVDCLVFRLEAKGLHGRLKLLWVNRARSICVEKVEGLPDLFNLFLGQARALVCLCGTLAGRHGEEAAR
mmetsp:Transcript_34699/g.70860  ORF Transcript_34699/g.70860 Transcript_34699/m.70860 type:complete len:200 (+) Transcript_34699:119-718(+)